MKLFESLLDLALLPIAVVKDVFTLGMEAEETGKSYTRQKLEDIDDDLGLRN